jgi:CheY-like chemotaxis protein
MPKKILIIDDDPEIVSYLKDVFEDAGYKTDSARNGVEALEKVQVSPPDLITLDMEMPLRGGTMFYVKLRKEPCLAEIPVIIISGVGPRPPELSKKVPVLSKPIDPQKTLDLIKTFLGE